MNTGDFDDYWVQSPKAAPTPATPALQIDTIEGVEPLDTQFGVAVLKTVPDALYEPLFGQPDDTPLHTYAILDAAKVPNLPELLEVSGLAHRCLFKGDAYDELKDVAPWVVQLEDGNGFTRGLFTRSDAPWHLWDAEAGIFIRSGGTLDDIWRHFRKFTKVQDENEKWFYWRFWEGRFIKTAIMYSNNVVSRMFGAVFENSLMFVSKDTFLSVNFKNNTLIKQSVTANVSEVDFANIYALMDRGELMNIVKHISPKHWIFPFIAKALLDGVVSPKQLEKIGSIRKDTAMHKVVLSFLTNVRVMPAHRAQALSHVLGVK